MVGFQIAGRRIGRGEPTYVIAEVSANHAGSFEEAAELVRLAATAGADAVKLQTYTPDTMTVDIDNDWLLVESGSLWEGRYLYDLYREAQTPWEWQPDLRRIALQVGIELFSSAFDVSAVEFLEDMGVPAHKVASFENVDLELISAMAATGKPLIISTGMASMDELEYAIATARDHGAREVALLKCTSSYPAPPSDINLRAIPVLRGRFDVEIGFSDHTLGTEVPIAAVAMGATLIEKHFTRSRDLDTADKAFSLNSEELAELVKSIRNVEASLGSPTIGPTESEKSSLVFRRSIFVIEDIKEGEEFTRRNLRVIRPGYGLAPRHLPSIVGRLASRQIERGTPLSWEMVV